MAAYLQNYADHFQLLVHTGVRVQDVTPGFAVTTSAGRLTARHVVVATGPFHDPVIPAAAGDLDPSVPQRHAYAYRGPADIPTDEVTIGGGGNSAAQIALELTASHRVTLVAPREPWFVPAQGLGLSSYRWMSWLGILDADVEGRVVRRVRRRGDPIFGRELRRPLRRGELVLRTSRVVGAAGRTLTLADGSTVPAPAVVWCTGLPRDVRLAAGTGKPRRRGQPRAPPRRVPRDRAALDGAALAGDALELDHPRGRRRRAPLRRAGHRGRVTLSSDGAAVGLRERAISEAGGEEALRGQPLAFAQ